jgi:pimeloyl-ACP methyl ester carboxylesterase
MALDSLRAKPDWGLAYRAAFQYDGRAALARLSSPAVLIAKEADPLHEHLARLGIDAPTLEVRSVANEDHVSAVLGAFDRDSGLDAAPSVPAPRHDGGTSRRYVRTSSGLVHVRLDGDPDARPLLFVHGSPGSADSFDPLIRELARDHLVVAPDTLGNGYSDPAPGTDPEVHVFADAVAEVLGALSLGPVTVYGSHTGACIALELAVRRPGLVSTVVADGLPVFDEAEQRDLLENYFVSLAPERHGEHLLRAWHTIRDVQLWWPWYRQDAEHRRPTGPSDPEVLHRLVVEFLKSGDTYRASYAAAFRFPSLARLAQTTVPVVACAEPEDMLFAGSREGGELPGVSFVRLDSDAGLDAACVVRQVTAG